MDLSFQSLVYENSPLFRGLSISVVLKLLFFVKIIFKSNTLGIFELEFVQINDYSFLEATLCTILVFV